MSNEYVMPAGTYYIGDLCYVMHKEWNEVCEMFFQGRSDQGCNEGKLQLIDGREFVSFNTAYGDGTYNDQYGNYYYVDAGLIGCIKIDDIREEVPAGGTNVVTFDKDFTCYSDGKRLQFGHLVIDTDPPYEEEEDEDEYEEEEY